MAPSGTRTSVYRIWAPWQPGAAGPGNRTDPGGVSTTFEQPERTRVNRRRATSPGGVCTASAPQRHQSRWRPGSRRTGRLGQPQHRVSSPARRRAQAEGLPARRRARFPPRGVANPGLRRLRRRHAARRVVQPQPPGRPVGRPPAAPTNTCERRPGRGPQAAERPALPEGRRKPGKGAGVWGFRQRPPSLSAGGPGPSRRGGLLR